MKRVREHIFEGIFRKPRLWSNRELRRIAPLFTGAVVNVSGWNDSDKSVSSCREYFCGDYNEGIPYVSYFTNATSYTVTNYPKDKKIQNTEGHLLDLENALPESYRNKFDVVFCHTVLEHIFDIFKAFENLCLMSKDVIILIVPFAQEVHDYRKGYKDYWRFTPFGLDALFKRNGFSVLYRSSNNSFQSSIYYFYVASRKPGKWERHFRQKRLESDLKMLNVGNHMFPIASIHLRLEEELRRIASRIKKRLF